MIPVSPVPMMLAKASARLCPALPMEMSKIRSKAPRSNNLVTALQITSLPLQIAAEGLRDAALGESVVEHDAYPIAHLAEEGVSRGSERASGMRGDYRMPRFAGRQSQFAFRPGGVPPRASRRRPKDRPIQGNLRVASVFPTNSLTQFSTVVRTSLRCPGRNDLRERIPTPSVARPARRGLAGPRAGRTDRDRH